jgi:4-hydroxy-tetrahydrodipicolinate synthase
LGILITNTGYTGITLSPELINRLADLENVVAVKNSVKMDHMLETLRLAGDRILVSHPDERTFFSLMVEQGSRLSLSSPSPFLLQKPGWTPIKDYTALVLEHRIEEAAEIARSLNPAREVFQKWMLNPWPARRLMPIAYLKAWSDLMGMVGGAVRPPLLPITEAECEELRQDLLSVGLI